MSFAEIAALTIHDVKNSLAQLAGQAEARGDIATLRTAMDASAALTRLLVLYKTETSILLLAVDAHSPADLVLDLLSEYANEYANEAVHKHANATLTQNHIEMDAAISSAPTLCFYDATLVRMILSNALQNALRYARHKVTFSALAAGAYLEFRVQDDGAGYPDSVLADTGATAAITAEGTGLGLRLAKKVATLHTNGGLCGDVALANEPGAVFILRLPL